MIITTFLDRSEFQVKLLDKRSDFLISEVSQYQLIRLDNGEFIVINIYYFLGVFNDRGRIRCKEMFTFPDPDNEGASFPRSNQRVWIILVNYHNHIRANHPFQGYPDSLFQARFII